MFGGGGDGGDYILFVLFLVVSFIVSHTQTRTGVLAQQIQRIFIISITFDESSSK